MSPSQKLIDVTSLSNLMECLPQNSEMHWRRLDCNLISVNIICDQHKKPFLQQS